MNNQNSVGARLEGDTRWWVIPLFLGSLLSQGLAVSFSGRTPHILIFDLVLFVVVGWLTFEMLVGTSKFYASDTLTTRLFIALFLCQMLSLLFNDRGVLRGFYAIKVSLFAYLSYLVVTVLIRSREDLRRATYSLVAWGGVIGLVLGTSFFMDWAVDVGPEASYVVKDEVGIGLGRSNYVAVILILILPIGVSTIFSSRGVQRMLLAISTSLMGFGLMITMSKGAFISLTAGSICAIPLMRKRGLRLRHVIVFLIVFCVFLSLVPRDLLLSNIDMFAYRFATPDLDRVDLWNVAWETFIRHPLLGVGPGAIYLFNQRFAIAVSDTHNFVLQQLAELGLMGAIPFFAILGIFLRRTYELCRTQASDESLRFLPLGLFVALLSTLAHGLVEPTFPGQQYAVVFWLCMALVFVQTREHLRSMRTTAAPLVPARALPAG